MRLRKTNDTNFVNQFKDSFEETGVKALFFGSSKVMKPIITGSINLDILASPDRDGLQKAQKAILDLCDGLILNNKKFEQPVQMDFAKYLRNMA